jgi:hypothetical protein
MSIETIPGTDEKYFLIAYDKNGEERDDPDGMMSEQILDAIANESYTDVFLLSHGWKGDVDAAKDQYDGWLAVIAAQKADIERMKQARPGFKPLYIGFHWPSKPWGEEDLKSEEMPAFDLAPPAAPPSIDAMVDEYADIIADTDKARAALRTIFEYVAQNANATKLPKEVSDAYKLLDEEAGLGANGTAPEDEREPFDPDFALAAMKSEMPQFSGFSWSDLLSPLKQLSFWTMKKRARKVGESGGADLIRKIQAQSDTIRIHLMGHSFGCIVVSSMVKGSEDTAPLSRPIDSVVLVQGAVSLWSLSSSVKDSDNPGYFRSIIDDKRIKGAVVTTRSAHDRAVGWFYPIAAGIAFQSSFPAGIYPLYGGLGAFGAQGKDLDIIDGQMLEADKDYNFAGGRIYNLECSNIIKEGGGASGAHNDIAHNEVAHAIWQAALTSTS